MASIVTPDSRTVEVLESDRTLEVAGRLDDVLPLPVQPLQNQFLNGSIFIGAL